VGPHMRNRSTTIKRWAVLSALCLSAVQLVLVAQIPTASEHLIRLLRPGYVNRTVALLTSPSTDRTVGEGEPVLKSVRRTFAECRVLEAVDIDLGWYGRVAVAAGGLLRSGTHAKTSSSLTGLTVAPDTDAVSIRLSSGKVLRLQGAWIVDRIQRRAPVSILRVGLLGLLLIGVNNFLLHGLRWFQIRIYTQLNLRKTARIITM
jgi:hypothetical protein